jgi:phosphoadenosine phosphosulfate reductase
MNTDEHREGSVRERPLPPILDHIAEDDAEGIVRAALTHFGPRITLSCSFGGAGGMVLLDMAVKVHRDVDVFVLDTDLLFPETYATIEAVERKYGIKVRRARPLLSVEEQNRLYGDALWARDPNACCNLRKVETMARAVKGYEAWITALRRDQAETRAGTKVLSWDEKFGMWKLCPLAAWDEARVLNYLFEHDVPNNPLLEQGYASLGCTHCTKKAEAGRGGRWAGFGKVECGLHTAGAAVTVKGAEVK